MPTRRRIPPSVPPIIALMGAFLDVDGVLGGVCVGEDVGDESGGEEKEEASEKAVEEEEGVRDGEGIVALVIMRKSRESGVCASFPRCITSRVCCLDSRVGVVKNSWLNMD